MLSLANCIGDEASNRYDSSALNPIVAVVSLYGAFPQKLLSILDTQKVSVDFRHQQKVSVDFRHLQKVLVVFDVS